MERYVVRRLMYSAVVLVAWSLLVFMMVSAVRGSSIGLYGNPAVAYETIPEIAARRHVDDSLFMQYLHWVREAVTEQFGTTIADNRPILPDLLRALGNTLQPVIAAEVLAVLLAILVGVITAVRQSRSSTTSGRRSAWAFDARVLTRVDAAGARRADRRLDWVERAPDCESQLRRIPARGCTFGLTARTTSCCR